MTIRLLSLALAALLCLGAAAAAQNAADRTFGPGRVGAIVKDVKPADLARIYGAENVKYAKMGYEGGESPGAYIYQDTPDFLQVFFDDDSTRIEYVIVGGQNWSNKSGLRKGTSLAQLERLNGGPFKIQGFGADEAGRVHANGRVLKLYTVYLSLNGTAPEVLRTDGEFSSRHPAFKSLRPTVSFIHVGIQ